MTIISFFFHIMLLCALFESYVLIDLKKVKFVHLEILKIHLLLHITFFFSGANCGSSFACVLSCSWD